MINMKTLQIHKNIKYTRKYLMQAMKIKRNVYFLSENTSEVIYENFEKFGDIS